MVPDFPPLDPPCLYDLSYGRRLDPNTKAFSAAYNDAVDIANKNRLTFLALEYATNPRKYASSVRLQPFSTKENGAVDTATTIKTLFSTIFKEEKRGGRYCNNN